MTNSLVTAGAAIVAALASVVAAGAAIAYTLYAKRMWESMKHSNDNMRESNLISRQTLLETHRPIVGIKDVLFYLEGEPLVVVQMINTGPVPATGLCVETEVLSSGDIPATRTMSSGFVLSPNCGSEANLAMAGEDVRLVINGEKDLSIKATVTYGGIRGDKYRTVGVFAYDARHHIFNPGEAAFS